MTDLAVVSKSGEVLGRFVIHPGNPVPANRNNLKVAIVVNDEVLETHEAFLSSTKGNMDKLDALCKATGDLNCVIKGSGFGYEHDVDLVALKSA